MCVCVRKSTRMDGAGRRPPDSDGRGLRSRPPPADSDLAARAAGWCRRAGWHLKPPDGPAAVVRYTGTRRSADRRDSDKTGPANPAGRAGCLGQYGPAAGLVCIGVAAARRLADNGDGPTGGRCGGGNGRWLRRRHPCRVDLLVWKLARLGLGRV